MAEPGDISSGSSECVPAHIQMYAVYCAVCAAGIWNNVLPMLSRSLEYTEKADIYYRKRSGICTREVIA